MSDGVGSTSASGSNPAKHLMDLNKLQDEAFANNVSLQKSRVGHDTRMAIIQEAKKASERM
ncbi:hypothetical protein [Nitratireductor pacificus]|uniref:hypothetical protein n=1 Tax=Nitratireductor pacificus TaxID=1231180 RepID=UPI0012F6B1B0|nr:hypothetical protein [Nitratireductor pacificus]